MEAGQLTVIKGDKYHIEQVFLIPAGGERLLGRSSVCHFRIIDPLVSSLHCQLEYLAQVTLRDLLSANGVYVNDELVDSVALKSGDRVRVGKMLLEFSDYRGETEGKTYIDGEMPDLSFEDEEQGEASPEKGDRVPLGRRIKKTRDLNICRLGIKNGLFDHEQVRSLISLQQKCTKEGKETDLATLLISEKMLERERIENLLQEHNYYKFRNKDIQFGKAVVGQRLAIEEKVQECLRLQERYFQETGEVQRLGEILVQRGYITVQENNRLIKGLAKKRKEEEE